jgi:predicted ATPase
MIKRIKLNNYRSFRELDLPLDNLTVLIGRNGAGKSNLLSLFDLLAAAAEGELNTSIRRVGGFNDLRFYETREQDVVSLEVELDHEEHQSLYYRVELGARGTAGYVVLSEKLERPPYPEHNMRYKFLEAHNGRITILKAYNRNEDDEDESNAAFENAAQELILPQLRNEMRYPVQVETHRYLRDLSVFQGFGDYELDRVRSPQLLDVVDPLRLAPDGSNLISVLNALRQDVRYDDTLTQLEDVLRVVFPDFRQFDLPSAGGGKATLAYRSQHIRRSSISAQLMSDGQLRFLGLLILLMLPNPPRLIAIDEPEIGMHPKMIEVFADVVKETAAKTQVILSTHSPQLLDHMPASSICVVERKEGASTVTKPDPDTLSLWLDDYAPGYLWTNTTLIEE